MKTLLVEDNAGLRQLLTQWLSSRRHSVAAFENAEEAWEACRDGDFDVALLDWILPGMSGPELCQRLRTHPPCERIYIVILTGQPTQEALQKVLDAGADDYWVKPIQREWFQIRLAFAERQARNIADRLRAETALKQSVDRFELASQGTNDGIYDVPELPADWDNPNLYVWYSPRFKALLGFQEEEFPNRLASWANRLHPEDKQRVFVALKAMVDDGVRYDVEYRLATKSGDYRWFGAQGRRFYDHAGKTNRMAGAIRDITERKLMEEALRGEQRLLRQLLDVHERERQLFAYELHDGLIQHITASLMHLESYSDAKYLDRERADREFGHSLRLLQSAVQEARQLLSGLRPPILDEAGVVAAIEYLTNEAQQFIPELRFEHDVAFHRLAPPLESAIFRIVQEGLTNVRRHSQASQAQVTLAGSEGRLRLEIRDNGIGFDPRVVGEESFGLQGIRQRARLLGGRAVIDSAPDGGTRILVEFPLPVTVG